MKLLSTDTPKTEAQISILDEPLSGYPSYPDSKEVVPAEFAKELERSLYSTQRALREEQLKTQALTEALEEIHSEAVGALNNAVPEDAPEVVESLGVKAEIAIKRFSSAPLGTPE